MVVHAKTAIQNAPAHGVRKPRKIFNLHSCTNERNPVLGLVYGVLLIFLALAMLLIDPINLVTNWFLDVREGSFVYTMWQKPTYELRSEVWVYNYTNIDQFIAGEHKKLKLEEIGPFRFQEIRTNENMTIDNERGILLITPNTTLRFLPEESIAHYKDVFVQVPNIALISISSLAASKLGYLANTGLFYSITALGSQLFRVMTVEEYFWGYYDPIVTIANNLLPGWIDFGKIGIMDRFYAQKFVQVEIELRDLSRRFSINSWDQSPGLHEQGYTDYNTSIPCNRIKGSYEGLMVNQNVSKTQVIPIFRKQACRVYPFIFDKEIKGGFGFTFYRFKMEQSAFNKSSPYACRCTENCLPDGFVDISNCFYGFPIALSKPHFLDAAPEQLANFEGMKPDPEKHTSFLDIEPTLGVPIALSSNIQVNLAVRTSSGNPITRPLKDKLLPLLWLSLYCEEAPLEIVNIFRLRFAIAPPLVAAIEIILFILGFTFGMQSSYRILKQRKSSVNSKCLKKSNSIIVTMCTEKRLDDVLDENIDENGVREIVSLLTNEDTKVPDM